MRVLHTGTFDVNAGGPALSSYLTIKGLRRQGVNTEMFMYPLKGNGKLIGEEVPVHYTSPPWEKKFAYSPHFRKNLKQCGKYDIYHAQGIWQYPTYALIDHARSCRKPYLITPRGMLYPQDIRKSSTLFKHISLWFRLKRDLQNAACIHVTCEEEKKHCRDLGIISPIAVIPNPIEIKSYQNEKTDNLFRLGYLGRIHPRKNIESLIYAFADLDKKAKNAELLIIGGGDEQYENFLKSEVKRLQLSNVRFTGFLSGTEKEQAIASLSVLAMPSEFENLGNVILEGLVRKIPCIATKGSPWEELNTYGCGWWVNYDQQAITEAIQLALQTSPEILREMGENGYRLVKEHYSIETVTEKMIHLYHWIMDLEKKPSFVF